MEFLKDLNAAIDVADKKEFDGPSECLILLSEDKENLIIQFLKSKNFSINLFKDDKILKIFRDCENLEFYFRNSSFARLRSYHIDIDDDVIERIKENRNLVRSFVEKN